jgi:hypothetical protein
MTVCRLLSAATAERISVEFVIVEFMYICRGNADLLKVRQKYQEFRKKK